MGCDIHIVSEKKVGDRWVGIVRFSHIDTQTGTAFPICRDRNYKRFADLAGVRGDGPEPRGLPPDASELSRLLYDTSDDHSHSWLPAREAVEVFLATEYNRISDFARKYPAYFYFKIDEDQENLDDYRIVFWFDN